MASEAPESYCVCVIGDITQPASAPIAALSINDIVTIFFAFIPDKREAVIFEAQARIERPVNVNLKKKAKKYNNDAANSKNPDNLG